MKSILHSCTRSTSVSKKVRKLFAKRRAIAENMIESADSILSGSCYSNISRREAYAEKKRGIALLTMSA